MRFKLIGGMHQGKDANGVVRTYKRGDVIETDDDLALASPDKFEKIPDLKPVPKYGLKEVPKRK